MSQFSSVNMSFEISLYLQITVARNHKESLGNLEKLKHLKHIHPRFYALAGQYLRVVAIPVSAKNLFSQAKIQLRKKKIIRVTVIIKITILKRVS